jgi:hypothetical protein
MDAVIRMAIDQQPFYLLDDFVSGMGFPSSNNYFPDNATFPGT